MRIKTVFIVLALGAVLGGCLGDVPPEKRVKNDLRVSAGTVRSWMNQGRDILFVDLRTEADWQKSTRELPGSVRVQTYQDVEDLDRTVPKDRYVVGYCI